MESRSISFASDICHLDRWDSNKVRLLYQKKVFLCDPISKKLFLCDPIIKKDSYSFYIDKDPQIDIIDLNNIAEFLPFIARPFITAQIVDLIPSTSWFSSLANMLSKPYWDALREQSISSLQGCYNCGSRVKLEAHEIWDYDDINKIQKLLEIRCLCKLCHETMHLGRANVMGNFNQAFKRLCLINRIREDEEKTYLDMIFSNYERRSRYKWSLDLSLFLQNDNILKLKSSILFAGDNLIYQPANNRRGDIYSQIINAVILTDDKNLYLT